MRIISRFNDYYDSGMGQGQDLSLIFMRETSEWTKTKLKDSPPAYLKFYRDFSERMLPSTLQRTGLSLDRLYAGVTVQPSLFLFSGALYPCVKVSQRAPGVGTSYDLFTYSHDELSKVLLNHKIDLSKKAYLKNGWRWHLLSDRKVDYSEFFKLHGSTVLRVQAIEHQLPILRSVIGGITVNPRLVDFEFFRCLNTWQAYQELSMFMGNLASRDDTPINISDKDRVTQHGFDRYSFRKRPR